MRGCNRSLQEGVSGVGEGFRTTPLLQGTTRFLKFLRTVIFFKAVSLKETGSNGKSTQTTRLS